VKEMWRAVRVMLVSLYLPPTFHKLNVSTSARAREIRISQQIPYDEFLLLLDGFP